MGLPSNFRTIALIATAVGLAVTNVLTLLDDQFHDAAFGIVAGAIRQIFPCEQIPVSYSMIVPGPTMLRDCDFGLKSSPTMVRKREVEGATAMLHAQVAMLENKVASLASEICVLTERCSRK
jgi:hypothetical protein